MRAPLLVVLVLAGSTMSASAAPPEKALLAFQVPIVPLAPGASSVLCKADRAIVVSSTGGPAVNVSAPGDGMTWVGNIRGNALKVTTPSGATGTMAITYRDTETLRAIDDEGVAETIALDYRTGRAVFTTARNTDGGLMGRVHYMKCVAVSSSD